MDLLQYTYKYTRVISINKETGEEVKGYYPFMPCRFKSKRKATRIVGGLLSTGSDEILIPKGMAEYLELPLTGGKMIKGVGGEVQAGTATVEIILGTQGRFTVLKNVEVRVLLESKNGPILIGRKPLFELYDVTFIEADLKFKMVPHKEKKAKSRKKSKRRE